MKIEDMKIEDIKKIKLGKDDVLLVKIDSGKVTDEDMLLSKNILKDVFPNNSVIFCPTEIDISVISKEDL